jgi:hypothetical protein
VDLIPACSLLVRSEVCRKVGPWDARFPLYWGDTDWCARVLREGYRVCCHEDSRAWHREWEAVQRGFGAPDFARDHLRGALLFFLRYAPGGRLDGVRHLILRAHAYAALEHLTLREELGRAWVEAVEDVLRGSFLEKDFARSQRAPLADLEELLDGLAPTLGRSPRVLLNQIGDPALARRVREACARRFDAVRWEELPRRDAARRGWSEYRCTRFDQVPALVRCLATRDLEPHALRPGRRPPHAPARRLGSRPDRREPPGAGPVGRRRHGAPRAQGGLGGPAAGQAPLRAPAGGRGGHRPDRGGGTPGSG